MALRDESKKKNVVMQDLPPKLSGAVAFRTLVSCILVSIICTACFDPIYMMDMWNFKGRVEREGIVVTLVINEKIPGAGSAFDVSMLPAVAEKMGAPDSINFLKLLNEKVTQEESIIGHKICKNGYKINRKPPFVDNHDIWQVRFDCKTQ